MNGESKPIVDPETLAVLRDVIGDTINDIIKLYLEDVPHSLQLMLNASNSADFVAVGRLAHSLKSSSANLGAMQTSKISAEIENAIKNGLSDSSRIFNMIEELQHSFDQSSAVFRDYLKKL